MRRLRLEITGRVQGVGYRWFARERARALGLAGWVRNRADGSVEVAASGEPDALARFVDHLRVGPSGASVAAIRDLGDPGEDFPDPFAIQR